MKKYIGIIIAVVFGLSVGLISRLMYSRYVLHYCDIPYKKVCVKSHKKTSFVMSPVRVGNTTTMRPTPVLRTVCDEYKKVLKDRCKEKANDMPEL